MIIWLQSFKLYDEFLPKYTLRTTDQQTKRTLSTCGLRCISNLIHPVRAVFELPASVRN